MEEEQKREILYFGGAIAFFECTAGALFHSLHIPLTGQWLSLLQIGVLSLASRFEGGKCPAFAVNASSYAMVIKAAVSPGKKLTPMIAIFMQGALYNAPFFLWGSSVFSRIIGASLASLWGVFQPFATLWIIFGGDAFDAWSKALNFIALDPLSLLLLIFAVKMGLAVAIAALVSWMKMDYLTALKGRLKSLGLPEASMQAVPVEVPLLKRMIKRVTKWPMLTTLIVVPIFLAANKPDAFGEDALYFFARSLAGLLLLEALPWERLFFWLKSRHST